VSPEPSLWTLGTVPNGGIFYGQNPGTSEWGASVCEIVGVFSGPDIHVVVRWEGGTLSVKV